MVAVDVLLGRQPDVGPSTPCCLHRRRVAPRTQPVPRQPDPRTRRAGRPRASTCWTRRSGRDVRIDVGRARRAARRAGRRRPRRIAARGIDDVRERPSCGSSAELEPPPCREISPSRSRTSRARLAELLGQSGSPSRRLRTRRLLLDVGGYIEQRYAEQLDGALTRVPRPPRASGWPLPAIRSVRSKPTAATPGRAGTRGVVTAPAQRLTSTDRPASTAC